MKLIIRYLAIITLALLILSANANTLTVKHDGTGDYTVIQDAIDASSNGDTVLVYPGTYYENPEIRNKQITLGSLYLLTGDNDYIYQTIINGNQSGSCINYWECNETNNIVGFTVTNGSGNSWGNSGGGIFLYMSKLSIYSCIITENSASKQGGGIWSYHSEIYLSNTTIKYNSAYWFGGGIQLINSPCEFDTINLCNIYCNTASTGTDVFNGVSPPYTFNHIVVDTFTVIDPDYYYLFSNAYDSAAPGNSISWDINNGKLEQTSQNIYVSNAGDNSNSGLTPEEPLKNIWHALLKMKSDSISPDTIILENGNYAPSVGEKFPLSLKRDVSIKGKSKENTILDAENVTYHLHGILCANNYTISNLTLKNGNGDNSAYIQGSAVLEKNNNVTFNNLLFTNNTGEYGKNCKIQDSRNFKIINSDIIDNKGGSSFLFFNSVSDYDIFDTNYVINCRFINNNPDTTESAFGSGLHFGSYIGEPETFECVVINSLFVDNYGRNTHNGAQSVGVGTTDDARVYLINCTLANNMSDNPDAAAISVNYGSDMHIFNSIIYNNQYAPAYMFTMAYAGESNLYVNNSLVDGGENNINIITGLNNLYYDETNIDEDPLFYGGPDFPYNLSNSSPCIDAGTLEIPEWIELPETDLAGNPRIYGTTIDMGAYEWNPTVGVDEYKPIKKDKEKLLVAAPNPFRGSTTITATYTKKGNYKIEIYSNFGQRVRVLFKGSALPGNSKIIWAGVDENGKKLPSGVYYVIMFENDDEMENLKIILND